jgi:small subunit ribosomal protein S2
MGLAGANAIPVRPSRLESLRSPAARCALAPPSRRLTSGAIPLTLRALPPNASALGEGTIRNDTHFPTNPMVRCPARGWPSGEVEEQPKGSRHMTDTTQTTGTTQDDGAAQAAAAAAAGAWVADAPAPLVPGQPAIALRTLVEAGVHFGHQTRRWNPKMRPYIYGARSGIHIIDLDQTVSLFTRAYEFVSSAVGRGGHVLFVGTKRQAQSIVVEQAQRSGMYFVTNRWLGGTLTNFRTIRQGLDRLRTLERMKEEDVHAQLPKKEVVRLEKERERLEKFLGGLKGMATPPAVLFIIDPTQEQIAVAEAKKLHIPVVAITDTNCNPDVIDYPIPGNDDAIRAIAVVTSRIADACLEGAQRYKAQPQDEPVGRGHGDVAVYPGGPRMRPSMR